MDSKVITFLETFSIRLTLASTHQIQHPGRWLGNFLSLVCFLVRDIKKYFSIFDWLYAGLYEGQGYFYLIFPRILKILRESLREALLLLPVLTVVAN